MRRHILSERLRDLPALQQLHPRGLEVQRSEHPHAMPKRFQSHADKQVLSGGHHLHPKPQKLQKNIGYLRQLLPMLLRIHRHSSWLRGVPVYWLQPDFSLSGGKRLHLHCLPQRLLSRRPQLHRLRHSQLRCLHGRRMHHLSTRLPPQRRLLRCQCADQLPGFCLCRSVHHLRERLLQRVQ